MKILFLANRLPHESVAGGHRLIYQRMRRLKELGHTVGLAALIKPKDEKYVAEVREAFHEVVTVPYRSRSFFVRSMHDYMSMSMPAIFWKNHSKAMMHAVGDMVERTEYDVVIAEFGEMGQYLYRNPYLSAVNKVVSCHRCLTDSFSKYIETSGVPMSLRIKSTFQLRILERYEFEMYRTMDHIFTLTAEDRFTLLNRSPQLPVSVIPPGIDFKALEIGDIDKPDYPVVMMCAYFADKSNHDGAMWFIRDIWPLIVKKYPDVHFQLVGAGVSDKLKRAAESSEQVTVIGTVDDLRPYRKQASILINPMRLGSGLRVKVLEAMATGRPVVSTTLGAAGIPAQNGSNCFIADTPELFAESINWLLNDKQLAKTMGEDAFEMTMNRYNIHSTIRELEAMLKEVVTI